MEKPFGTDLESARELNATVHEVFDEEQIFRIDHFLGKEAAQNILALRFANGLFEPIWNRHHIEHIQIDVPETLAISARGQFYDHTGAFRTWSSPTCCRCSPSSPWSRQPHSSLARSATRSSRCSARCSRSTSSRWSAGQYEGYRSSPASPPTPRPRR